MQTEPNASAGQPRPGSRWPWVFLVLGLGALGLVAFLFHGTRSLPGDLLEGGRSLAKDVRSVAEAFRTGTITTRFISYASEMSGSNYLQFATLKQMEVFERTDRASVLWGQFALPDVVVRAEAPVEYTYYLDLDDRWELLVEGTQVLVQAPRIRYNTPAIDVSEIRYEVKHQSLLRNEDDALEKLRAGLTGLAKARARDNVALVRELGRKKTAEFIRNWLLTQFEDADDYRIEVRFADEAEVEERKRPSELR